MLKNLLTVVCATSPHRFGSDISMIEFNYSLIKSSTLKDCDFIITADGVNPRSNFNKEENKKLYEDYLNSININLKDISLIRSKKHIGLTMNYMQAWNESLIKTPYVLLMNHDTVFTDLMLGVDFLNVLRNFPDFVNILMFPRHTSNSLDPTWWRNTPIQKHPDYCSNPYWDDCKISFGNQDNCCIVKKDKFQSIIDEFYRPEVTHFLEDSIQSELSKIEEGDLFSWARFGGCIHPSRNNIHLDGQSKAGVWRQEDCRGGEHVWSDGNFRQQDETFFKKFFIKNPGLRNSYNKFLKSLFLQYEQSCRQHFYKFKSTASMSLDLRNYIYKDLSVNNQAQASQGILPIQNEDIGVHIRLEPFRAKLFWEDNRDSKHKDSHLILKLFTGFGTSEQKVIKNGGHPYGCAEFSIDDLGIKPTDKIRIHLMEYIGRQSNGREPLLAADFNLSFCEFKQDELLIHSNLNKNSDQKFSLNLKKNNGTDILYTEEDNIYKIQKSDLGDCSSVIGFFCTSDDELKYKTSWTFECQAFTGDPKYVNKIQHAYDDFMQHAFQSPK